MSKLPEHLERTDERLAELLAVERRLEALLREAAEDARRRVEAARALANDSHERRQAELEAAAATEEQADLEAHRQKLAAIAAEGAAKVAALEAVTAERIDALARGLLDRLLEGGPRG